MAPDLVELLSRQRPALEQHRRWNCELPDIVEEGAQTEHGEALGVDADPLRHGLGEDSHARRMTPRIWIAGFDRGREGGKAPHRLRLFKAGGPFPPRRTLRMEVLEQP